MKKNIFFIGIALICIQTVFAVSYDDKALLKKAEESTIFTDVDFSADYSILQSKPGQGNSQTDAVMYRRDKTGAYTIVIKGPSASDAGKGYVQYDSTIWFFDPRDRRFTFTNSKDKFEGSNATQGDFTPQYYTRDYEIIAARDAKLGSLNCRVLKLKAKTQNVDYPFLELWLTEKDGLVRMKKDYSLSESLLRTTAIPSYQTISKKSVPVKMLIIDNLRGKKINNKMQYEKTQITISNVSFAIQRDIVFTKAYLEMINQ